MVKFVENELQTIKNEVNEMWTLVYQQLSDAYQAVLNADSSLAEKINNNLERIGDYADSIARFVIRTQLKPENKILFSSLQIHEMFDTVLSMLNTTYESLQKQDLSMAKSVFDKDEVLDILNQNAIDTLADHATEHPEDIKLCLETAGIFRKLERAGDHINNLAEETIFYIDAEVLKHRKSAELQENA